MAGAQVVPPFPVFTDVDGNPVDDGYIYVGQEGLDPIASPVSVFWDRALSVPATQPIRTIGGYPSNAGVRSVFYSSEPVYSILVRNKNGTAIYSDSSSLSSTDLESRLADQTDPSKGAAMLGRGVVSVQTIADLLLCPLRTDLTYDVAEYNAGTGVGGDPFYWDASSTASPDGGFVFQVPGVPVGRFKRRSSAYLVDNFGAIPGNTASQKTAFEAADAAALAVGAPLCARGGATYYADFLNLKSRIVLGNDTTIIKTASTGLGLVNWGDKPVGMFNGTFKGFNLDGNGKDNVVCLRLYGNHTESKVRDLVLRDSDFYAFSVGGLTSQGDKLDVIEGLDIDGVTITSERGNVTDGTEYSFGLEIFPGVTCKDLKIRNVTTFGKIINKIHSFDGVDIDSISFKASAVFNPLSSGYCEINNCKNLTVGPNCLFDSLGTDTYYALLIGGTRVVGGQTVTGAILHGRVIGRTSIEKVSDLTAIGFTSTRQIAMYNDSSSITLNGCSALGLLTPVGNTGTIDSIEVNGGSYGGPIRFDVPGIVVTKLTVNGGTYDISTDQFRLNTVGYALLNCPTIRATGTPLTYMLSAKSSTVILKGVILEGGGTWDRPILAVDATGIIKMYDCVLERMVSSTILASGSAALTANIRSIVNGV